MRRDPNAFQGRGQQPPVDGTGIVLGTLGGLAVWCVVALLLRLLGCAS
jgi:hypothetical protein